jgi:hypothetical protein
MKFYLLFVVSCCCFLSFGQSEEKIVSDFFKFKNEGNYAKAMEYYPKVDQITTKYFQNDTNELNFKFALFDLALKVDSIQLAQNNVKKLEALIEDFHIGKFFYSPGMFRLHDFYKRTNNYSESIRILKKCILNQIKVNSNVPKIAEYYDEMAYVYYCLGNYDMAIENYNKSIPILKLHYTKEYYISSLDLCSRALYNQKRYEELIIPVVECISFYDNIADSNSNQRSLLINLLNLAKSYRFLDMKKESNDTYKMFFDKSIKFIESSNLSEFLEGINEQRLMINTNTNAVYNLSKQLEYYNTLEKIKPEIIEDHNFLSLYYYLSLAYTSFNDTRNNGERYFTRIDPKKALEFANIGINYSKKNKLTSQIYYKDLLIKRLEILLWLNQIDRLKGEIKKSKKYLTKEYPKSKIDHLKVEYIECQTIQYQNLHAKANEGYIKMYTEFQNHPEWLDSLDFLLLYFPILSELESYYYSIENYDQSKKYKILKDKVNYLTEQSFSSSGKTLGINYVHDKNNLSYSDSLLNLLYDSIMPYFSNYSNLKLPIENIISNLESDLTRSDLNVFEKLETLKALGYIYNKLEKKVFYKNCLLKEKKIRDQEFLWNDSTKVEWSISYAYVLNQLYETSQAIDVLKNLTKENIFINKKAHLQIINNLSFYYSNLGDHQKSKEFLSEYLSSFNDTIRLKNDPKYLGDYILGLGNYGQECISSNDYKSAYRSLNKAFDLTNKYLGESTYLYNWALMNLADFMIFTDEIENSKKLLLQYYELTENKFGQSSEDFFLAQKLLFTFYSNNKMYIEADALFYNLIDNFVNVFFSKEKGLNSIQFKKYLIEYYKHFNQCLDYALLRKSEKPHFLTKIIEQYFVMFDMDFTRDNFLSKKIDQNEKKQYYEKLNEYYFNLQLSIDELLVRKINLSRNKKELDSIENLLFSSNPFFTDNKNNLVSDISQSLSNSEIFVFSIEQHPMTKIKYYINKDSLVKNNGIVKHILFTISNDKTNPVQFDIYEDSVLKLDLLKDYYQEATRSNKTNYKSNAMIFTKALNKTLDRFNNKLKIYVYPSDFLSWSNFDMLLDKSKNDFFVESREIVYIKDPYKIKGNSEKIDFKNATLIGDPNYNMNINYMSSKERIGGIGVKWNSSAFEENPVYIIENVIPNYPAQKGGIISGDTLVKINGTNVENIKKIVEINNLLKGPIGSKVMVTIRNSRGTKEIELIRKDLSLQNKMSPVDNLPNTAIEVNKIENILVDKMSLVVNKFINDNATEENVKSIKDMDIIHIATHSFFLNRESDIAEYDYTPANGVYAFNYYGNSFFDNGLVFSGVNNFNLDYYNGSKENGFLYSCEISNLSWDNTELVVLSSCESGMGLQGVYSSNKGLIGALQKAGVKNVIASLWNVDDKVTQEFMVEFYSYLAQNKSISESLRLAKLTIKKNHPEPYYWAPFVLYTLN